MEHVSTVVNRVLDDAGICTQCYKVPCQCDVMYEKHLDNQMFGDEAEELDQPPPDDEDDEEAYEEGEEYEDEEEEEEDEDWLDEDEEWEDED